MGEPDKALLIELLEYPRKRIVESMDLRFCPHAGFYSSYDIQCIQCYQGMECVWMNGNDELIAVERKTAEELKQQLLIAVDFIDSNLTPHHLSRRNCTCDNCVWLRKVQQILDLS